MKHRPILFMLTLLLAAAPAARPQTAGSPVTVTLTLAECIRMGHLSGPNARMAAAAYESRKHRYEAYTSRFLPQLSVSGDAPQFIRSINSITQPDGSSSYLLQRQAQSSVSLALAQELPWTGTQIWVSSALNRLDNLETRSSFYRSTPLSLSLRQPLFSINTTAWTYEQEELTYRSSHREFVEAMEDAAIDVTNKFFGFYLASMTVANARLNLSINDTLYQVTQGRFNVGKIAENDLLQSELAVLNARTNYENALIDLERAKRNLLHAVGLPEGTELAVIPDESVLSGIVDPAEALRYARENRSDMLSFELQKLSAERSIRQAESSNSLSMTVSANIGLNQKANGLQDAYAGLLDQQQFSVQFQLPLLSWGAGSHAVEAARAEASRVDASIATQRFTLEQEVSYQVRRFTQLQRQVMLAGKADTVAQRRYDVARERFVIGKIDVTNLFLAQSEKDNAYRSRIQALWDYWTTYYRLRRLTLYDFATRQPLVASE
ncbi:MAG: TolC family protein [Bacteroidetes bacterium]|nr:MAG: TolC family protein [Bacteroidota bacterium]